MKYIVITGIMENLIFKGHPIVMGGEKRIWNDDSCGQSFPEENCKAISEDLQSLII